MGIDAYEDAAGLVARSAAAYVSSVPADPALLLWVHAALVESTVVACQLFGTPLAPADGDRYVAEMAVAAELVGVPAALIPVSLDGLRQYLASVRDELRCTPAAADAAAFLLDPPGLDEDIAEIWQDIRDGAVAAMPEWARDMYGFG